MIFYDKIGIIYTMKTCPVCKKEKEIYNFHKLTKSKNKAQSYCMECKKQVDKIRYQKNPKYFRYMYKIVEQRNLKYIWDHISKRFCVDCGENDIAVLDFDHIKGKRHNINAMRSHSIKTIDEEINKCVVRCANCHRKKTAKEGNWEKLKYSVSRRFDPGR